MDLRVQLRKKLRIAHWAIGSIRVSNLIAASGFVGSVSCDCQHIAIRGLDFQVSPLPDFPVYVIGNLLRPLTRIRAFNDLFFTCPDALFSVVECKISISEFADIMSRTAFVSLLLASSEKENEYHFEISRVARLRNSRSSPLRYGESAARTFAWYAFSRVISSALRYETSIASRSNGTIVNSSKYMN